MSVNDLPNTWKSCLTEIKTLLSSQNEKEIFGGLCGLRAVVKKFEYGDKESWKQLDEIANNLFD